VFAGSQDNSVPLYATSLRQRLEHFLAEPKTMLLLNGTLVNPGGAKALFDLMDEKLPSMVSEVKAPAEKVWKRSGPSACCGTGG